MLCCQTGGGGGDPLLTPRGWNLGAEAKLQVVTRLLRGMFVALPGRLDLGRVGDVALVRGVTSTVTASSWLHADKDSAWLP